MTNTPNQSQRVAVATKSKSRRGDKGSASQNPRTSSAVLKAAQRLSDAQELYPPAHMEIAKRKLTLDLLQAREQCSYCGESHPQHGDICPVWEQHKIEDAQDAKEAAQS